MSPLFLLLILQAPPPTVGDTIWLTRAVLAPAGAEVRAVAWEPAAPLALLGRPVVRREREWTVVAYPAVAWVAGRHEVAVPGPVVIRPDGITDSLPAEHRVVEVRSVLPEGAAPESLAVQPETGILEERITTPWPVVAALVAAGLLFAPFAWWWRRRGPPMGPVRPAHAPVALPLLEWGEAGEHRAVAAVAALRLRQALLRQFPGVPAGVVTSRLIGIVAEQRPAWPADEIGTLLRALESAQFAEAPGSEVVALAERAGALVSRLEAA